MKKSLFVIAASILLIIFFTLYAVNIHVKTQIPEIVLQKAFNESGAQAVSSEIYFWAKLDSKYSGEEKLKELVSQLSQSIGIIRNTDMPSKLQENDLMFKYEVNGVTSENRLVNICGQTNRVWGKNAESFISIRVVEDSVYREAETTRSEICRMLEKYGINPRVNSCITGYYGGKLGKERLNTVSSSVFKVAQARKVEGISETNLISLSGYSSAIQDFLQVKGKKVNINLAIRYNTYEDRTYIWLATPIITTEY